MKIQTGKMPFKGFETYYRIVGEKTANPPLLLLHGGPGSTHNYFEVLDSLAELTHRQVISYDQIGCGESFVEGHPELWTLPTWIEELEALRAWLHLDRVHLLGQSWGGMLIIAYLVDRNPSVLSLPFCPVRFLPAHCGAMSSIVSSRLCRGRSRMP